MSNRKMNGQRIRFVAPPPDIHFTNRRSHTVGYDGTMYSYLVMPQKLPATPRPPGVDGHMSRERYRGDVTKLLPGTIAFLNDLRSKHKLTKPNPKWY